MESSSSKIEFPYHLKIQTRWHDNDQYGHVNNVVYYSYFDTAVNHYLVNEGGLDIHNAAVVGFVANSSCDYLAPISYPEVVDVGIRVQKLGTKSVAYEIGIFIEGDESLKAFGQFVHVFVRKADKKSVVIPQEIRDKLEEIRH